MIIKKIKAQPDMSLFIEATDGRTGTFDISPYFNFEAFEALRDFSEFAKVSNGGYFVEWECGADLSADTLEAKMMPADALAFIPGNNSIQASTKPDQQP